MSNQKVKDKLAILIQSKMNNGFDFEGIAEAIIQSPFLRIELIEPKFTVENDRCRDYWWVFKQGTPYARCTGTYPEKQANEYCAWLNSRESK